LHLKAAAISRPEFSWPIRSYLAVVPFWLLTETISSITQLCYTSAGDSVYLLRLGGYARVLGESPALGRLRQESLRFHVSVFSDPSGRNGDRAILSVTALAMNRAFAWLTILAPLPLVLSKATVREFQFVR
jgi:hypothetical protein